jgi:hypothetical protein
LHQLRQDFGEALPRRFMRSIDDRRITLSADDEVDRSVLKMPAIVRQA